MCNSKAEGGQRCHGHTVQAYEKARENRATIQANQAATQSAVTKADVRYEKRVVEAAAHHDPRSHEVLSQRLFALDTGATPKGDDPEVIRGALEAHPAPPKPAKKAASSQPVSPEVKARREALGQAIRDGVRGEPDTTPTQSKVGPPSTPLEHLLRTGGLREVTNDDLAAAAEHGTTVTYGHVTIHASQLDLAGWSDGVPVDVDAVADVPHTTVQGSSRAGFLRRLISGPQGKPVLQPTTWTGLTPRGYTTHTVAPGVRDYDDPDYLHGTVTITHGLTAERRYYKAIEKHGVWEIQHRIH